MAEDPHPLPEFVTLFLSDDHALDHPDAGTDPAELLQLVRVERLRRRTTASHWMNLKAIAEASGPTRTTIIVFIQANDDGAGSSPLNGAG